MKLNHTGHAHISTYCTRLSTGLRGSYRVQIVFNVHNRVKLKILTVNP